MGHGSNGAHPQRVSHRRRDHVERRRLHRPFSRNGSSSAGGARRPRAGRGRAACGPTARLLIDVRSQVPRSRGTSAAPAENEGAGASTIVATAEAGLRPVAGGFAFRLVPDDPRDLPGMPSRRVRRAFARRDDEEVAEKRDPTRRRRYPEAVALRRLAPIPLCRQLHLRRRCAVGGASRAGAFDRSGATPRSSG